MKSDRVPLMVDSETYTALKALSDITGAPVARIAREALQDWMGTIGAARLEAYTEQASGKVLAITSAGILQAVSATAGQS